MEKRTVTVRALEIGAGLPKICVPLVAENEAALLEELKKLEKVPYDMTEFRADFYRAGDWEEAPEEELRRVFGLIRGQTGSAPLLVTYRTGAEGGNREISFPAYRRFLLAAVRTGLADLIDVELLTAGDQVGELVRELHAQGGIIVGSSHDFTRTPSEEEMIARLVRMQEAGMDITKLAVMPENRQDVARLLYVTAQMEERFGDRPCVTMAMGPLGAVTRVSGAGFGSAFTFAAAGKTSAPGQMPAADVKTILELLGPQGGITNKA